MTDERKSQAAENIWLNYFNQELYRQSVITETERNKMTLKIENRKPPVRNNRNKDWER